MSRPGPDGTPSTGRHRAGRLADLIGPAAFPVVYFTTHDVTLATYATTAGALAALVLRFALDGRLATLSLVSGAVSTATGLLASVFGSEAVFEEEPTVVHLAVALGLLVAWMLDGRPAKALFGGVVALPDRTWATLCLRFALFSLAMAGANEVVHRTLPTAVWALFHFPGQLVAHLLFGATQLPLILDSRSAPGADGRRVSG